MVRVAGLPQAKSVVVLADQDDHLAVGILNGPHPLFRVEGGGIEKGRVLAAIAPLDIMKSVRAVVQKKGPFHPHPGRLVRARQDLAAFSAMAALVSSLPMTCIEEYNIGGAAAPEPETEGCD